MKKDFEELKNTFKSSIKTWDYFVNWDKALNNIRQIEISLNKMNYLLGKENFEKHFLLLLKNNRDIIQTMPTLLAVRDSKLEIYDKTENTSSFFDFSEESSISDKEVMEYIKESGIEKIFKEDGIKNIVDYVFGIEVGLDSNGRKNRGGSLMEEITEIYIKKFTSRNGLEYMNQANAKKIKNMWNIDIKVNKSSRSFDFAIFNPKNKKIKLVEVNFYNGGGSKLKAVCGEFRSLFNELKTQDIDFIWITDGLGWNTALRPLEETYNHNEHVFNLSMVEDGVLGKIQW